MPKKQNRSRRRPRRQPRTIYHATTAKADNDFSITAGGLGLLLDRPVKIVSVVVEFCSNVPSVTINFGVYSPLHSEAVVWSRAHLVSTIPRRVTLRVPRITDWGHYNKADIVLIGTLAGPQNSEIRVCVGANVLYGPPTNLVPKNSGRVAEATYLSPLNSSFEQLHLRDDE